MGAGNIGNHVYDREIIEGGKLGIYSQGRGLTNPSLRTEEMRWRAIHMLGRYPSPLTELGHSFISPFEQYELLMATGDGKVGHTRLRIGAGAAGSRCVIFMAENGSRICSDRRVQRRGAQICQMGENLHRLIEAPVYGYLISTALRYEHSNRKMSSGRIDNEFQDSAYFPYKGEKNPCALERCICQDLAEHTRVVEAYGQRNYRDMVRLQMDIVAIQRQYLAVRVALEKDSVEAISRAADEILKIGENGKSDDR